MEDSHGFKINCITLLQVSVLIIFLTPDMYLFNKSKSFIMSNAFLYDLNHCQTAIRFYLELLKKISK